MLSTCRGCAPCGYADIANSTDQNDVDKVATLVLSPPPPFPQTALILPCRRAAAAAIFGTVPDIVWRCQRLWPSRRRCLEGQILVQTKSLPDLSCQNHGACGRAHHRRRLGRPSHKPPPHKSYTAVGWQRYVAWCVVKLVCIQRGSCASGIDTAQAGAKAAAGGILLGCSKCRWSYHGCAKCKDQSKQMFRWNPFSDL